MVSNKSWDFLIEDMFEDACKQYRQTYSHKKFDQRYKEMTGDIRNSYDEDTASKVNNYLLEMDLFGYRRAKELYILGMKDAVSLLKRLDII